MRKWWVDCLSCPPRMLYLDEVGSIIFLTADFHVKLSCKFCSSSFCSLIFLVFILVWDNEIWRWIMKSIFCRQFLGPITKKGHSKDEVIKMTILWSWNGEFIVYPNMLYLDEVLGSIFLTDFELWNPHFVVYF